MQGLELFLITINQIIFPLFIMIIGGTLAYFYVKFIFFRKEFKAISSDYSAEFRSPEGEVNINADDIAETPSERQLSLLKKYHNQGLMQSNISFWFSIGSASFGFMIIIYSVVVNFGDIFISDYSSTSGGNPIFTLVAGTVVEAVAGLFFVQSNKSRVLMSEFFDKARSDRKLDECLIIVRGLGDSDISMRLRAYLALGFSDIDPPKEVIDAIFYGEAKRTHNQGTGTGV